MIMITTTIRKARDSMTKEKINLLIMNILLIGFPAILCDFPIWLSTLFIFCAITIPYLGAVATLVIWIFSFMNVIHMPFSIITILYFVVLIVRIGIALMFKKI